MQLNDQLIRASLHRKRLRKYHKNPEALVVDELGLKHGQVRADVAVVNGSLCGYEIKSDKDTLGRLAKQIPAYNAVFDKVTIVAGEKHVDQAAATVPNWWGVLIAYQGSKGAIHFKPIRAPQFNTQVDMVAVAQLLWHSEVAGILDSLGYPSKTLRQSRSVLYEIVAEALPARELQKKTREILKTRKGWRCPQQPL